MKRDWTVTNSFWVALLSVALSFFTISCGGGGGGGSAGGGGTTPTTTTISGKVTLSSTVTGKPAMMKAMNTINKARMSAKSGSIAYNPLTVSQMDKVLQATGVSLATALSNANVEVYDADKPEWLYPVATTTTSSTGDYTIEKLCSPTDIAGSASLNSAYGATYKCGDSIPVGNYTIITSKYDVNYGSLFVAVQAVVKKCEGAVTANDLTAQDSDGVPEVTSMFGLSKNTDGTYGSTTTTLPANAAIQVTFSMGMARLGLIDAISVKDSAGTAVSGNWKISSDLLSATFDPTSALTPSEVYSVTILGGKAAKAAKSVYGKAVAADVKGSFKAASTDITPPGAVKDSPTTSTNVAITTPIRFAANEPVDINAITVTSSPTIGDKPFIQYIGKIGKYLDYNYVYEVVPANALKINTTYSISISGGKDLAGLSMDTLSFSFSTEAASAGVTGTTTTEIDAQTAVKDGFGKWVRALNDRNMTQLTSIMTGDFFWLSTGKGKDSADLNGDGRLSVKEFTDMISMWMDQLEVCGSTVSGDVVSITVSGTNAIMAFNLNVTSTNGAVSSCSQGPDSTLYAVFQNINGAWLMAMGSDEAITTTTVPGPLTPISLVSPAADVSLSEPTSTQPLLPDFKWTGVSGVTTYALIVVDANSRYNETGWIALVDGANTAGNEVSAKYTPKTGQVGSIYVVPAGGTLGFETNIDFFAAGGSYSWAVIGFKTKTISDFSKQLVTDPLSDIGASSDASNFSVLGTYKELAVTVKDATTGLAYDYSDMMGGYNVGNSSKVNLTIQAPVGSTATTAYVDVGGYTQTQYTASFSSGVATVSNVALSDNGNWVQVSDMPRDTQTHQYPDGAMVKEFSIVTTGGAEPLIKITSVTGKKCDSSAATLTGPNLWNDYSSSDVCTIDISGTVTGITGTLNLQVWSDSGKYRSQLTLSGTTFAFSNVPVYNGWNSVSVADMNWTNQNHMGIDNAGVGSVYTPAINISSVTAGTALTPTYTSLEEVYYDAGSSASVTIAGTMQSVSTSCSMGPCSGWNQRDANWQNITGGQITSSPFSIPVDLYQGWNYIEFSDANNNHFRVVIYTTNPSVFAVPNEITSVKDSLGNTLIDTNSDGYLDTTDCSVTLYGTTTSKGNPLYASLYYYSSTSGQSINEYPSAQPVSNSTDGTYSMTFPVYSGGENWINVNDSNWYWAGVSVKTTGTCTATAFGITSVSTTAALTKDIYGEYNAGSAATVTIAGTAATGKTISTYVSGLYYDTYTVPAASNAFSQQVKIYNGYNYISITDGSNWQYLTVYTTGGSTYTEPFKITSVTSTDGTVVSTDTTGYSYSGSATTITLSGETTKAGTVYWYGGGSSGSFIVTAGAFTSVPITLWYGSNYVDLYLYPTDGSYSNWDGVYFYTTGGTGAPVKIVQITSPAQSASISSATSGVVSTPVTGTIDLSKYSPSRTTLYVYGYVYDFNTYQYTYFSNQVYDQTTYGDSPITVDGSGNFSLTALINSNSPSYIEVYAYDDITYMGHGHQIYVNNINNYTDFFWKPGSTNAKAKASSAKQKAHKAEFLKRVMKRK